MSWMKKVIPFLLVTLSLIGYIGFSYTFKRTDHLELFVAFGLLFISYLLLVVLFNSSKQQFYLLFSAGLLFRLLFLFTPPHLSDDYFRFTWDGELAKDGISSFSFQPRFYADSLKDRPDLFQKYEKLLNANSKEFPNGMNSKQYYSIYPTLNQAIYHLSSSLGSPNRGNLTIMRILMIIAEVVSFFVLRRLLKTDSKSRKWAQLYWLNPLIIIELTGNLHFDGFAITFMLLTLLFLTQKKWLPTVISFSLAIVTKLNPIFLFGAIFGRLKLKKTILLGLTTTSLVVILLALILDQTTFFNFAKSFGLYFAWFEFNTGIYSMIRDLGLISMGVDLSSKLSIVFPILTILLFLKITFFSPKIKMTEKLILLYFIYFTFSPIVHPWYITVLIPFGILSGRLYPILWSFLVFFTYFAYQEDGFAPSKLIVYFEYALVYLCYFLEMKTDRLKRVKEVLFKSS